MKLTELFNNARKEHKCQLRVKWYVRQLSSGYTCAHRSISLGSLTTNREPMQYRSVAFKGCSCQLFDGERHVYTTLHDIENKF